MPLKGSGGFAHGVFQKAKCLENPLMEDPALVRQRNAVADPIKQLEIQCILQRSYLPANSALGDAKLLGRAGNAQTVANNRKGPERGETWRIIHG